MNPIVLIPSGSIIGPSIPFVIIVFGFLLPGALFLFGLFRILTLRELAAEADDLGAEKSDLVPGRVVLCGRVRLAEEERVAVRVEITQQGEEFTSFNRQKHRWYETDRRVIARPFYIDDAQGRSVRIEPTDEVLLVDHVDQRHRGSGSTRVRAAELSDGEPIYAVGQLVPGDDPEWVGAGQPLVLRAGDDELLLSSHPLSAQYDQPANIHSLFVGVSALFFVLALIIGGPIVGRVVAGTDTTIAITGKYIDEGSTRSSNGTRRSRSKDYIVTFETRSGWRFERSFSKATYDSVSAGQQAAALSVAGIPGTEALGDQPCMHWLGIVLTGLAPISIGVFYLGAVMRIRPWWEVDLIDEGSGLLDLEYQR